MESLHRTTIRTRISYAATDAAGQLIFCFIANYILKFYTDVAGLAPAVAGTILLIARVSDGFDAPIWGLIFDNTKSVYGKYRPWFLWLCFPFAVMGILSFLTPGMSAAVKPYYYGVTYILCSILYTGINTPVTSLLASLTDDTEERVTLTVWRMFGSKAGVLAVNFMAMPLVAWFGAGNDAKGFATVMPFYAAGSVLLFLGAFANLEEKIQVKSPSMNFATAFRTIPGNWPWIIIFSSSLFFWIAFIARVSMVPFFFEYQLHRKDWVALANSLDVLSLISIFALPWLCALWTKTVVWKIGLIGGALSQVLVYVGMCTNSFPVTMASWVCGILLSGMALALPFSLLSDSVDYGEWKTGIRAAGLLTAIGAAFTLKAGAGFGGALPAWIMGLSGYVPNAAQTPQALVGIQIGFIWIPVIFYLLAAVPVMFYGRFEAQGPAIVMELEKRRGIRGGGA